MAEDKEKEKKEEGEKGADSSEDKNGGEKEDKKKEADKKEDRADKDGEEDRKGEDKDARRDRERDRDEDRDGGRNDDYADRGRNERRGDDDNGDSWRGGRGRGRGMGPRGYMRSRPGDRGGFVGGNPRMRDEIIEPVDREKTCPMLLRLFCKVGEHHRDDEFSYKQQPTDEEVRVHTWRDATMAELTELLAQVHREVRQSGTKCTFKVLYPDANGKFVSHVIGSTAIGRRLHDDVSQKTLAQIRYQVGDFFSVAIYPPKSAMRPTQANAEEKKEEEQEAGETRTERRREGREQEDE
mmetsp:Transcript_6657/g.23478  ORF Transcript_6657/g.23478 Transcript_6657/m.23478 type:complete len:296 (-) Transcript_6657:181-1068(-)